MKIELHPYFEKAFKKRIRPDRKLFKKTTERIKLFQIDKSNLILKDHSLVGSKKGYRSFSVTGDIRIVYLPVSKDHVIFVNIGTHNQVY